MNSRYLKLSDKIFNKYGVWPVIIFALVLRIFFYCGHVFSDDSYYVVAAYDFYFTSLEQFTGYPAVLARIMQIIITGGLFKIFGVSEFVSVLPNLIFSLCTIPLIYYFVLALYNQRKTALLAAFLYAILPLDIVFATVNFTDLPASFLFYLSTFLLLKSIKKENTLFAVLAGITGGIAVLYKVTIFTAFVVLGFLFVWLLLKKDYRYKYLTFYFLSVLMVLITEGIIYYFSTGDFFHRFVLLEANYRYSWYDFFPAATGKQDSITFTDYLSFFGENIRYMFLRRFYLFFPLIAFGISLLNLRVKRDKLISVWFILLCGVFLFISVSVNEYRPMYLRNSWYLFPLMIPAVIIIAQYFTRFNFKVLGGLLIVLFLFSTISTQSFREYFGLHDKNLMKEFITTNKEKTFFSDHHTLYGIVLFTGYGDNLKNLNNAGTDAKDGDIIIFNERRNEELKLQGFDYSTEKISDHLEFIKTFDHFEIYKFRSN